MPDQDVEDAEAQVAQDLDPLERVHLAVEVLDLDAELAQVVGEVLGHPLGERRDEDPLAALHPLADPLHEVVDLALGRADRDGRVDDAGGPDQLLDDPLAPLQLVGPGRGAHVDRLVDGGLELLERERPVVERRREPEPEVDQDLLAGPVVLVHAPRPGGSSCATRRRRAASRAGSSRAASTAASPARARDRWRE